MSEQKAISKTAPLKGRISDVCQELRIRGYRELAAAIKSYAGTGTTAARVSGWVKTKNPHGLALIALLYEPDPRACFEYLSGKRTNLPRIHVYSAERTEQALRAICEMLKASGACSRLVTTEAALDLVRGTAELQELIDQEVKRRGLG